MDDDSGDTLTYELPALFFTFTVGANTGQMTTLADLDFEAVSSYTVPLYVRDSKGPDGGGGSLFDGRIKVTIGNRPASIQPGVSDHAAGGPREDRR